MDELIPLKIMYDKVSLLNMIMNIYYMMRTGGGFPCSYWGAQNIVGFIHLFSSVGAINKKAENVRSSENQVMSDLR